MNETPTPLSAFVGLISELLSGTARPAAFKAEYMRLWRQYRDSGQLSELNARTNDALDRVFTAAESYCEDASLRDQNDLDEQQLMSEVAAILPDMTRR